MTDDSNMIKCACKDCVCEVSTDEATRQDGELFCGTACAKGHVDGNGCGHAGCECHG